MAKKNFGSGISSLINGGINTQKTETVSINAIETFETTGKAEISAEGRSDNDVLKETRGYGRKTFIMSAELSETIAAWAWYSRETEKSVAEKAFEPYLASLDQSELKTAVSLFRKRKKK